jgi:hypothetical protein
MISSAATAQTVLDFTPTTLSTVLREGLMICPTLLHFAVVAICREFTRGDY